MRKSILLCIFVLLTTYPVLAQQNQVIALNTSAPNHYDETETIASANKEYIFEVYGDIPTPKASFEEEHFLGGQISGKWTAFNQNYTHVYDVSIGFTDSAVEIVKPIIYKAVNKVNNYFKKCTRKGTLSKEEATQKLTHILDCANVICFEENTEAFESALSKAKTAEEIVRLFDNVIIKRI